MDRICEWYQISKIVWSLGHGLSKVFEVISDFVLWIDKQAIKDEVFPTWDWLDIGAVKVNQSLQEVWVIQNDADDQRNGVLSNDLVFKLRIDCSDHDRAHLKLLLH